MEKTYHTYAILAFMEIEERAFCRVSYPIPLAIEENSRLLQDLCVDFLLAQTFCKSRRICMNLVTDASASILHVYNLHLRMLLPCCRWRDLGSRM
jgi:hypothetical protein